MYFPPLGHCHFNIEISIEEILKLFWRLLVERKMCIKYGCFLHIFIIKLKNITPIFFNELLCETMKIG